MQGYNRWREDDIQSAFHSIENGVSVNKSAKIHGVPEPTLRWRTKHDLKKPPTFNLSFLQFF